MALAPNANPTNPDKDETKRRVGCTLFIIVLVIAALGLLGWFLLWGRSIPGGEEAEGKRTTSTQSDSRVLHPVPFPLEG